MPFTRDNHPDTENMPRTFLRYVTPPVHQRRKAGAFETGLKNASFQFSFRCQIELAVEQSGVRRPLAYPVRSNRVAILHGI